MLGQVSSNVPDILEKEFTDIVEKNYQTKSAVLRHFVEEYVKAEGYPREEDIK